MDNWQKFESIIQESINSGELIRIILSKSKNKGITGIVKIEIRLVDYRGGKVAQFSSYMSDGKVIHKNLNITVVAVNVIKYMHENLQQCNLMTSKYIYQAMISRKGIFTIVKKQNEIPLKPDTNHNIKKNYIIPEGKPVQYLIELGIMDIDGNVKTNKRNKFNQINRYTQMLSDVIDVFPQEQPIRILDFGCGKSYLTFVMYHYFTGILDRKVQIIGLDLKKDVVADCESLARKMGFEGLSFRVGDIAEYVSENSVDMVVSLHACDTATDAALEQAVRAGAKVIFAVPCCQHELARQLKCKELSQLTHHGILTQRLSEIATDALRAAILEICGYKVQVMEFIETEHTPKNLMIRAVLRTGTNPDSSLRIEKLRKEYADTCNFLSVTPTLGKLLKDFI